jgi:hypothetical protein
MPAPVIKMTEAVKMRAVGVTKCCTVVPRSGTHREVGDVIVILLSVLFDQTAGNNVLLAAIRLDIAEVLKKSPAALQSL